MTPVLSSFPSALAHCSRRLLLPLLLAMPLPLVAEPETEDNIDWVDIRDVPEELRDRQCVNCGGRYIDPLANEPQDVEPEESDIKATAANTEMKGNIVLLKGGVEVQQGYRQLRGNEATLNREERSGTLSGDIELREPGVLLKGDEAEFFSKTGEATLQNSQFILHDQHIRGTALELNRDEYGLIHIHEGNISYCAPGEHDWAIRADEMELDLEEGLGTAKGARLDVAGVPIFYSPWLRFPLDDRRRTGFLWPDIGNDSSGGVDIAAPFYFNLAPNYDALYAPRFIEERGLLMTISVIYEEPNHYRISRVEPRINAETVAAVVASNGEQLEGSVSWLEPQRLQLPAPETLTMENLAPDPILLAIVRET